MNDQAAELRKLVLRAMRDARPGTGPIPRLVVLSGGQMGVGVTTLAVNLSVALADQGSRIVLIDADWYQPSVASLCGLDRQLTVADVLIAGRDIHEALQLGPAGIQIMPGLGDPDRPPEFSAMALERFLRQLLQLGRHADFVVVDLGAGTNDLVRRLARAAEDVIVVCTTEPTAVMDAYARIKLTLTGSDPESQALIVNRAESEEQSAEVFGRMNRSCQRFLGHGLELLGFVPDDAEVLAASRVQAPYVQAHPLSLATRATQQIAARLAVRRRHEVRSRAAA
jgi:flagellar biosynthesis protein FlhG